jgi:hypothetical protein
MKTKKNANQIAQMSIASIALFFLAGFVTVQAETRMAFSNSREISAAESRLDNLNNAIENSVRFVAPAVDTNEEAMAIEVNQAVERLDDLHLAIEDSIRFQAPADPEAASNL